MESDGNDCVYRFKAFEFDKINYRGSGAPKARSGHRITVTDSGDIYSFGGYNPNIDESDPELIADQDWNVTKPLFRELWKFSVASRVWTKLRTSGDSPKQLASHCAALIGRNLLVFGGTGVPFGETSSNRLYVCNLNTLHWNQIDIRDNGQQPIEQYGQALKSDDNGLLYVCGGTTGFHYTIDVHSFDLRELIWSKVWHKPDQQYGAFPQERYRHEIAIYDQKLFVIGGGTAAVCYVLSRIPTFDLERREWSESSTRGDVNEPIYGYPKKRRCHDCVQMDHLVYIVGGTNGKKIYDDLWQLDLNTLQWTKIMVTMPRPVYFHSACVSPFGEMTLFGGVTNTNHSERTNELYSIWLKVPPLAEMSWRAILHYLDANPSSKSLVERCTELRIPRNYMCRLT